MMNKKVVAGFELTLMIVSVFAFSYGFAGSNDVFGEVNYDGSGAFGVLVAKVVEILGKPMIGFVSATETEEVLDDGSILTTTTSVSAFEISSGISGAGCCAVTSDNVK